MTTTNPPFTLATRREALLAALFTVGLSVPLALGFVPTAAQLWSELATRIPVLPAGPWTPAAGFLLLSVLFFVSVPPRPTSAPRLPWRRLLATLPAPVLVATAYGAIHRAPSVYHAELPTLLWYVAVVPLGEELLFRGWLYAVLTRIGGDRRLTLTTPLPLAVWATALGFSLWHLQNEGHDPIRLVAFQCLYTFFTGAWLGWLRWRSGNVAVPVLAHVALNAAAGVL